MEAFNGKWGRSKASSPNMVEFLVLAHHSAQKLFTHTFLELAHQVMPTSGVKGLHNS